MDRSIKIAVVGAHLSLMPLNYQLTDRKSIFVKKTKTAPYYRLYVLLGSNPLKPGLFRCSQRENGNSIEVEIWQMPLDLFGDFVSLIPSPLGIGNIDLIDGEVVKGFICEPFILSNAEDITKFGGWRYYLENKSF